MFSCGCEVKEEGEGERDGVVVASDTRLEDP